MLTIVWMIIFNSQGRGDPPHFAIEVIVTGLYLDNGYLNFDHIRGYNCPFTFIIGGRGIGKTFGAQDNCIEHGEVYMFVRRTQTQTDIISNPAFSPVLPVLAYRGLHGIIQAETKNNGAIYTQESDDAPKILRGYTAALSTFSNIRGFSGDIIDCVILDEFIPERSEREIKHEADAFYNMVETINRNRELTGRDPVRVWLLSNSNSLASPILVSMDLVRVLERMRSRGQQVYVNRDRGICILLPMDSPISARKADTALYRATRGTQYADMALSNAFAYDDVSDVRSVSLRGMRLLYQVGPCYVYDMAGGEDRLYISGHGAGTPATVYNDTDIDLRRFVRSHPGIYQKLLHHKIIFESFELKTYLTQLYI